VYIVGYVIASMVSNDSLIDHKRENVKYKAVFKNGVVELSILHNINMISI